MSSRISGTLNDYQAQYIDREDLSNQIFEIAQYAELDINLFNTAGRLIATSQPLIYENELLSGYINPRAYIAIVEHRDNSAILDENVGSLKYKNTYIAVQSFEDGSLIGILSLPFFASKEDLDHHIIRVLVNFINIFTVIFMIFLVISYLASNGLTFPLQLITQKIRKTTLSGYNEPLSWNTDDEIGLMVSEYNKMLINLEESKKALAATEKESAWREMAQQVAHEIKNPLTPMKLNLQHIKRRIEAGEEGDRAQRERQINSLLEQVNTLSDIATSFSAFAKMPAPQSDRFEMTKLLREVIALYNKQESGEILVELEDREFMIDGDRQWISRAISNIIINGFQAARQRENPTLTIKCYSQGKNQLRLEIIDNGEGIPASIRDKVFLPNFSTKFTGSGIGLAMAKRAVEHAGGKIWFETREGVGTAFYIELHTI
jgi:nitrogen fixation/metabolism regulation signal transduction histidine kinase